MSAKSPLPERSPRALWAKLAGSQTVMLVTGLVVFALSLTQFASWISRDLGLNPDTVSQLIAARACVIGEGCLLRMLPIDGTMGGTTPIGIQHGALTNHMASLGLSLTGNMLSLWMVLSTASALAVLVMFLVGRALWGMWGGLACAALTGGALAWAGVGSIPAHPSFTPLPSALYLGAACAFLSTKRPRHLAAAGFAVGLAVQFHLAAFVHLLGLAALLFAVGEGGRLKALLLTGIALLLPFAASPAMFLVVRPVPGGAGGHGGGGLELAALLVVASIGLFALSMRRGVDGTTARLTRFLLLSHVPFAAALLMMRHEPTSRYLLPLYPGLIALAVAGATLCGRAALPLAQRLLPARIASLVAPLAATLIACVSLAQLIRQAEPPWAPHAKSGRYMDQDFTLSDARAVAAHLERDGWTYEQVFRGLRGSEGYWYLLQALGVYLPTSPFTLEPSPDSPDSSLLVMRATGAAQPLPHGWSTVAEDQSGALLVKRYDPILDWTRFMVCFLTNDASDGPCSWNLLRYEYRPSVHGSQAHLIYLRAAPQIQELMELRRGDTMLIALPLRLAPGDGRRLISLGRPSSPYGCGGAVMAIEGVDYQGRLPARSVWIAEAREELVGTVLIAWNLGGCSVGYAVDMPPAVMELEEDDLLVAAGLLEEEVVSASLAELDVSAYALEAAQRFAGATKQLEAQRLWWHLPDVDARLERATRLYFSVLGVLLIGSELPQPLAPLFRALLSTLPVRPMKVEPLAPFWYAVLIVIFIGAFTLGALVSLLSWALGSRPEGGFATVVARSPPS